MRCVLGFLVTSALLLAGCSMRPHPGDEALNPPHLHADPPPLESEANPGDRDLGPGEDTEPPLTEDRDLGPGADGEPLGAPSTHQPAAAEADHPRQQIELP